MSTAAQIAANRANAKAATGPRTSSGKATSSRNAVTHGLYSAHDYIRSEDKAEYLKLRHALRHELAPVGAAEHALAAEITHAKWRLRCCSELQAKHNFRPATGEMTLFPDPMQNQPNDPTQVSIDLARGMAQRLLRRSETEFRRLQSDREYLNDTLAADADRMPLSPSDFRLIAGNHMPSPACVAKHSTGRRRLTFLETPSEASSDRAIRFRSHLSSELDKMERKTRVA